MSGPGMTETTQIYDTIVIGGGFSGVCAARDVSDKGRSVLLLEAKARLGGRVGSAPFKNRSEMIELGGTWVAPKYHPFVARELERYNLELVQSHGGSLKTIWHFFGEPSSRIPVQGDDLFELERALYQIKKDAHRIDARVPRDQQDLADLDIPIAAYFDRIGVSGSSRAFLEMWVILGSGALLEEWSALSALSLIAAMDNSVYGWYGAVTEKFAIGTSGAIETMLKGSGVEVQLNTPVASVDQTGATVAVTTTSGQVFQARSLVLAAPLAVWTDITFNPPLSENKVTAARIGHPGRMKKIWMLVENMPDGLYASGLGTDFVQIFPEYTDGDKKIAVGFCPPPSTLDGNDLNAVTNALRQFVPDAKVLATDVLDYTSDPYLKGTWMVQPPGILSRYASSLIATEGRIAFAGADIAIRWLGWIDGALETGARAAQEVDSILTR
ncbi:NAD(P)/FAD-dependent oxidoreductase [Pseudotabrizicola sp. 4114]|uniref:flavin monoamine oxidase family protein n=1 Tax=Pseudotabrizicola sp. 4114 TaxID=2817731 RepID=UPI00285DF61D|nr:monoamine oxidase [Pseudorhodobacter sp. 4114]